MVVIRRGWNQSIVMPRLPEWKSTVGRMRLIGMLEGVSFLLLMGIAMPLKYFAGMPEAVKYTGWAHGLLFIGYGLANLNALLAGRIAFKDSVIAFVASLIPFGPFFVDGRFADDEARDQAPR